MAKGKGLLITLEGVDGSGKSTQARLLARALRGLGHDVLLTREPGGSPRAARIRSLLLDPRLKGLDPEAEALLFAADRRQHVADTLEPALRRGALVLCDRFTDSTRAYQGAGRGLRAGDVDWLCAFAAHGLVPDLTLWFDLEPRAALDRARSKGRGDRMEASAAAYFVRVRKGFQALARREPNRILRVPVGGLAPRQILALALQGMEPLLKSWSRR